jgi:hypothetical protein
MPLKQVPRDEALTKSEFHGRLRDWLNNTEEERIGPENVDGRTSWVYVRDDTNVFGLHADTKRSAVDRYLQIVTLHSDDLRWEIAESQRGNMTTVVYGPERLRYKPFYLYATGTGKQRSPNASFL